MGCYATAWTLFRLRSDTSDLQFSGLCGAFRSFLSLSAVRKWTVEALNLALIMTTCAAAAGGLSVVVSRRFLQPCSTSQGRTRNWARLASTAGFDGMFWWSLFFQTYATEFFYLYAWNLSTGLSHFVNWFVPLCLCSPLCGDEIDWRYLYK